LVRQSRAALSDALAILAHPIANRQATGVIGMFGALLCVCYVMFWGMERRGSLAAEI
jgi:hypothetical protein